MKKFGFLLLNIVVGLVLLAVLGSCSAPEQTRSLDEKAQDIYRSLMCPLCSGQTIAESQSELSAQMRAVVWDKLEQGETKEEILQFFVERYGETVLAMPPKSGFNLIAWLFPITGITVGGIVLWLSVRKWLRGGKQSRSVPVNPSLTITQDEKYQKQLEKELKDFNSKSFR